MDEFRQQCCTKPNDKTKPDGDQYCTCDGLYEKYKPDGHEAVTEHMGSDIDVCCNDLSSSIGHVCPVGSFSEYDIPYGE